MLSRQDGKYLYLAKKPIGTYVEFEAHRTSPMFWNYRTIPIASIFIFVILFTLIVVPVFPFAFPYQMIRKTSCYRKLKLNWKPNWSILFFCLKWVHKDNTAMQHCLFLSSCALTFFFIVIIFPILIIISLWGPSLSRSQWRCSHHRDCCAAV